MIDPTKKKTAEEHAAELKAIEDGNEMRRAEAHLRHTDWMVIRQIEKGIPIPADVVASREAARQKADKSKG